LHASWVETLAEADLKDVTSTSFGYIIAYLVPGVVLFYGLELWHPNLFPFLQGENKNETTIGPSVIFLLGCLASGLLINAFRWLMYEKGLCRKKTFDKSHFSGLNQSEKLIIFRAVADEHYRYHQSYGNISIAVIPAFAYFVLLSLRSGSCCRSALLILLFLGCEALLMYTAKDCYCKYVDRANDMSRGMHEENSQNG